MILNLLRKLLAAMFLIAGFVNISSAIPIGDDDKPIKSHKHSADIGGDIHGAWVLQPMNNGLQGILFISNSPQGMSATFNAKKGNENAEERCQVDKSGSTLSLVCSISRSTNGWIADSFMLKIVGAHLKGQLASGDNPGEVLFVRNEEDLQIKENKEKAARTEESRRKEAESRAAAERAQLEAQARAEEQARRDAQESARREAFARLPVQIRTIVERMVTIPGKNYEIGKYDVTQAEWAGVMGSNPSDFSNCGDTCPVEEVSWNDIQEFLQKLNEKTGKQYRLPTEAEWEYACYGGSLTEYCGSNDIDSVAWYNGNSNNTTHPVGQKQANGYGLYDMSGNVWQWMSDCYEGDCGRRVLRGGSWINSPQIVRAAYRDGGEPSVRLNVDGFRLARTLP